MDFGDSMHNSEPAPERASTHRRIRRVLVIVGHPRAPSFNASLGQAYAEGARAAGMEVRLLNLAQLRFDPDVHTVSPLAQPLEPDLEGRAPASPGPIMSPSCFPPGGASARRGCMAFSTACCCRASLSASRMAAMKDC